MAKKKTNDKELKPQVEDIKEVKKKAKKVKKDSKYVDVEIDGVKTKAVKGNALTRMLNSGRAKLC